MKPMLITATALALVAGSATAADVMIVEVDPQNVERMALKRALVEHVQETYGETVVYDSPDALPAEVNREIVPGNALPENVAQPVPEALGEIPQTAVATTWVRAGNHLVEIMPDRTIVTVVYDVLG